MYLLNKTRSGAWRQRTASFANCTVSAHVLIGGRASPVCVRVRTCEGSVHGTMRQNNVGSRTSTPCLISLCSALDGSYFSVMHHSYMATYAPGLSTRQISW